MRRAQNIESADVKLHSEPVRATHLKNEVSTYIHTFYFCSLNDFRARADQSALHS